MVCARADAPLIIAGSSTNRKCKTCDFQVMIAPTGQKFLAENQDAEIQCLKCYMDKDRAHDELAMAGSPLEIMNDLKAIQPNPSAVAWKNRN